jgi:hypothetical protein
MKTITKLEPQGTKDDPIKRKVRMVGKNSNHSFIVGIPQIIAEMAHIDQGTELDCHIEIISSPNGKFRLIYEN